MRGDEIELHARQRVASETAKSFDEWWRELEPELSRYARSLYAGSGVLLSSGLTAEDLLHDVAVLCLLEGAKLATLNEFRAFAFSRLRWRWLDSLRYEKRRRGHDAQDQPSSESPGGLESSILLKEIMSRLPQRQSTIMRYTLEGLSSAQIAEKLGIESASVRSLRRFAQRAMMRMLEHGERGDSK